MSRRVEAASCLPFLAATERLFKGFLRAALESVAPAGLELRNRLSGLRIGRPNLERETTLQDNLPQEHGDCIGRAHAYSVQHPAGRGLELRFHARRYVSCLSHILHRCRIDVYHDRDTHQISVVCRGL